MSVAKISLLAIYVVLVALAILQAGTATGDWSLNILIILAVVHVLECAIFFRVVKAAGGSLAQHLLNVFLFGIIHVNEIRQQG